MPRTLDPLKYPPQFRQLCELALAQGEVTFPHEKPHSLRAMLQAYLRALEKNPEEGFPVAEAKDLMVRSDETSVTICRRSLSKVAKSLDAVLAQHGVKVPAAGTAVDESTARLRALLGE